jgi:hypothetical protein
MSIAQITNVTLFPARVSGLASGFLDSPKPGSVHEAYGIEILGWGICRSAAVTAVEVLSQGTVLQTAAVEHDWPYLARAYRMVPPAGRGGFCTWVDLTAAPPEFELTVALVAADGRHHPLGTIKGSRCRLGLGDPRLVQPLLVATLGRSGSSWLLRLLGQHPGVLTYRPFECETRAGAYWAHVFGALAQPKSYLQPMSAVDLGGRWWLGPASLDQLPAVRDPAVLSCLGGVGVQSLACFCQERLNALYRAVASAGGSADARYFAEKHQPDPFVGRVLREWYAGMREIVLVRDPRDLFCSIEAFNAKRGYAAFGRGQHTDERDYIRLLKRWMNDLVAVWRGRPSAVHLLRYEDVVREPRRTLGGVLKYLELEGGAEVLDGMLQRASPDTAGMRHHRTSQSQAESVGRWQRDLPASLQDLFASEFAETLTELGYA